MGRLKVEGDPFSFPMDWIALNNPGPFTVIDGRIRHAHSNHCPIQAWIAQRQPQLAPLNPVTALMYLFNRRLSGNEEVEVATVMEAADHPECPERSHLETLLAINYDGTHAAPDALPDNRDSVSELPD